MLCLISAVQKSDSVIYTVYVYVYIYMYIHVYFFFSIMVYHGILNTVFCAIQEDLVVYQCIYNI